MDSIIVIVVIAIVIQMQSCDATAKDLEYRKGDFYEDFSVDDVDLTFENYEELFGGSHNQSGQLFDDAGIDSFFDMKEMSATNSNGQGGHVAEVTCYKCITILVSFLSFLFLPILLTSFDLGLHMHD